MKLAKQSSAVVAIATAAIMLGLVQLPTLSAKPQTSQAPVITNAALQGKKLFVSGENFGDGAVIFVNDLKLKTKNDSDNPGTILVAKKGGKKIKPQEIVSLQVRNSDGARSDAFTFFSGRLITIEDAGKTVELAVGERFVVLLKKPNYQWDLLIDDPSIIKKLEDVAIEGAQGLFVAERAGQTTLSGIGNLPCHKSIPPCLAPTLNIEVRLVVK